ncbi:MAG: PIN domain-containing protein [Acidobacteria bacterium]|nr:PIN domain-containing protein [Acidobacteriota bacterium]
MSRLYLLDTNTVSYIAKGRSLAARARLEALAEGEMACVSSVTEAELCYGLARARASKSLELAIEGLLLMANVVPWGRAEARVYGRLRNQQEAMGKPLGSLDMMIAAHAVALGATLVTSDLAFRNVRELLAVVDWASDLAAVKPTESGAASRRSR